MPELTLTDIVLLAFLAVVGAIAGWLARGRHAAIEKAAVKTLWQEEIDRQREERQRLADQNKNLIEQVSQHQMHHNKLQRKVEDLSESVRDAEARRDGLQRDVESREARNEKLGRELKNWQKRLPPLIERYRIRNEEAERSQAALDEALETIRMLEERRAEAPLIDRGASNDDDAITDDARNAGRPMPDDSSQERDNLKKIKGVGPAIEKTLNEMGIFSFRQLAEMGEYDIDRVARRLKGFHSRIHREDWIGQARTLLDGAASG